MFSSKLLVCLSAFSVVTAGYAAEPSGANRYNVLFIAVDDLRDDLNCFGSDWVESPNIDRLANNGLSFTNHHVQVATCGASRFAMLTGLSPATSKMQGNNAFKTLARESDRAQTLPEVFRRSGYKTASIGKVSHSTDGKEFAYNGKGDGRDELPNAWDELPTEYGEWQRGWGLMFGYHGGVHREDGSGHKDLMEFVAEEDSELPDGLIADVAIKQLQKWKDERFFIGVGFIKPHLPFVATKGDWDAFKDKDIPLAPRQEHTDANYWHKSHEFFKYDAPYDDENPLSEENQLMNRRAYYACVRYVDRQIGRVLNELETLGLADETIVVLWGDHGWCLGDLQMWGKHSPYEEANRSPLIVRVPGYDSKVIDSPVETIDIFPSLLELCQPKDTATARPLDGVSFAQSAKTGKASRELAISYWARSISVRDDSFRLILDRDRKKPAELYKIQADGSSGRNIASTNPERIQSILTKMLKRKEMEQKDFAATVKASLGN